MPSNPSGPVRRSQLIAPFGPGAMVNVPGGTSVIVAGLDYWFDTSNYDENVEIAEFKIGEWRLEKLLRVDHFRLPPDYRKPSFGEQTKNVGITIPTFRFPAWHFCSHCRRLEDIGMFHRGRVKCKNCESQGRTRYMTQVPFVAMCEHGHLQDFPWREWVHRSPDPQCKGKLKLTSSGRATLSGQVVECEGCGVRRNLGGITSGADGNTLTDNLSPGNPFVCRGQRPWLGPSKNEPCGAKLRGSLKSASNIYFANIASSLYLPRSDNTALQIIIQKLEEPIIDSLVKGVAALSNSDPRAIVSLLRNQYTEHFKDFGDSQLEAAVRIVLTDEVLTEDTESGQAPDSSFRRHEFDVLREDKDDELLSIQVADMGDYAGNFQFFSRITLVEKLRETRVLAGFSRIFPNTAQELHRQQQILWLDQPAERWLPAYTVFGEGIFFEFDEALLQQWERSEAIANRILPVDQRFRVIQVSRNLYERNITPRFVLIHTFSHLLMNQLTFECGYSSASLRERLYVSDDPENPMAGLLIYTAAGDSEGTLGGLVRMGKPGYLEPVLMRALDQAQWCSADPVCMEMGEQQGQGPDSCNLAACHNCALVPETACEEFNRFLDRGVVVGSLSNPEIGYFRM